MTSFVCFPQFFSRLGGLHRFVPSMVAHHHIPGLLSLAADGSVLCPVPGAPRMFWGSYLPNSVESNILCVVVSTLSSSWSFFIIVIIPYMFMLLCSLELVMLNWLFQNLLQQLNWLLPHSGVYDLDRRAAINTIVAIESNCVYLGAVLCDRNILTNLVYFLCRII